MNGDDRRKREEQLAQYAADNPRPLYQTIYDLAAAFREVGAGSVQSIQKSQNADFFVPAVVNTAFAVELLLKFFIVATNPDLTYAELKARGLHPHGHKYSELWDRLHPKFRGAVLAEYSMLTQAGSLLPDIPLVLAELGDVPFVDWRYPFEDPAYRELDYGKLEKIAVAMLRVGRGACGRLAKGERRHVV
ncbi:hypothetical protein N800_02860 [Lysobacter daejeonensis GH1-9]|uniref:HEPN domain-containing protein n=1 Tax=Lysobacter daejeonensis GH1-9 TaxID=1385517 RepID=A0A0A0EU39_9GAMM|nr:hypothetical protein [Lysobacter daejeonensis]KGM54406.1 hypothetical protein N800_02860 [Lysobacter daejeonensis GH1-9]